MGTHRVLVTLAVGLTTVALLTGPAGATPTEPLPVPPPAPASGPYFSEQEVRDFLGVCPDIQPFARCEDDYRAALARTNSSGPVWAASLRLFDEVAGDLGLK